jgi:hypothetical protein
METIAEIKGKSVRTRDRMTKNRQRAEKFLRDKEERSMSDYRRMVSELS